MEEEKKRLKMNKSKIGIESHCKEIEEDSLKKKGCVYDRNFKLNLNIA